MSTLIERLRIKAGVMEMGERIAWGSDTALMREAAGKIEALEAQLDAVGAGGVGAMMPKQLAAACDECGATHRPGENTLCPTFRPQQIAEPASRRTELSTADIERGWRQTFSTDNPFCPCNLRSFTKSVEWAEREIAKEQS